MLLGGLRGRVDFSKQQIDQRATVLRMVYVIGARHKSGIVEQEIAVNVNCRPQPAWLNSVSATSSIQRSFQKGYFTLAQATESLISDQQTNWPNHDRCDDPIQ